MHMLDLEPVKKRLSDACPTGEGWQARWVDAGYSYQAGWVICREGARVDPVYGAGGYESFAKVHGDRQGYSGWGYMAPRRAAFIASAPTDVRALVAEVEELRGILDRAWDKIPEGCTVLRGQILTAIGRHGCTECGFSKEGWCLCPPTGDPGLSEEAKP